MCGFCKVLLCVCLGFVKCFCVFVCGFCKVLLCVCLGFVKCFCVFVCMCGCFDNVWVFS